MMKILVVEDSPIVRDRVIAMLSTIDGVSVVGFAEDAKPAIAAIDANHPDLMVLDINLKTSNGRDVLDYVVREHPQTKIFVLSNQTADVAGRRLLRQGATRYFDKTTEFLTFRDAVATMSNARGAP